MDEDLYAEIWRRFDGAEGIEGALYAIALTLASIDGQLERLGDSEASLLSVLESLRLNLGNKISDASYRIAEAIERD